jgi:hypothetical protein
MTTPPQYEYTVLLLFPGYGSERENAEAVCEMALDWLNHNKETPGFRFNPVVGASLAIVSDLEDVRERIEADDSVALVILHGLDDDERLPILRELRERHVAACYTVDVPRNPKPGELKVVIGKRRPDDQPPAHTLTADTLTDPVDEDEELTSRRVGDCIAVMALGVMSYHWHKVPPKRRFDPPIV